MNPRTNPTFLLVISYALRRLPYIVRAAYAGYQQTSVALEEASYNLGAGRWRTFRRVTLPNIKWGVLYGAVLCTARALGEFGAVSVVSGHIRGQTNTLPLHVEILYNEYNYAGAFAVASLLSVLAVITLALKKFLEWKTGQEQA